MILLLLHFVIVNVHAQHIYQRGLVNVVQTTIEGARFSPLEPLTWGPFISGGNGNLLINFSDSHQTIFGFGSALTESAAFNFASLSESQRTLLASMLWGPPPVGNGYTAGRLHLGSADFSLSTYSLDETVDDYNLQHFDDALIHDHAYVIPLALAALKSSNGALNLFASPWSPPAWLKINDDMIDSAHPQGLIQSAAAGATYADYFVRYIKAMANAGIRLWGVTLQNEPLIVMKPTGHRYEACAWTAESQAAWIRDHLGPAIRSDNETAYVKLLGYDYNKGQLLNWSTTVLMTAGEYIDGFAFHWYNWGGGLQLSDLQGLEEIFPETFTLATEASIIKAGTAINDNHGTLFSGKERSTIDKTTSSLSPPIPGNNSVAYTYAVGELYALDLLGDVRYGSSGWIDWNAFLNITGGPNHINRSDIGAPILVDALSDSFYVQSPYYYVGHVSRYAPQGSLRVSCLGEGIADTPGDYDAVKDYIKPQVNGGPAPSGAVDLITGCFSVGNGTSGAIVVMNPNARPSSVTLSLVPGTFGPNDVGASVSSQLPAHSITTFTFSLSL
jgi:glucosylceramidase